MALTCVCYLSGSHLKGPVISQGRRRRSADESAGHLYRWLPSPLCAKCLFCVWQGAAARELAASLAGSEFSHLTPCCSAKVRSGAVLCAGGANYRGSQLDVASPLSTVPFAGAACPCAPISTFPFVKCWSGVACPAPLPLKHSAPESRGSSVRAILHPH